MSYPAKTAATPQRCTAKTAFRSVQSSKPETLGKSSHLLMATGKTRKFKVGFGLIVVFAFAVFLKLDFRSVIVDGHSMLPTLTPGERVIVSNAYWLVGAVRDGDIVVVKDPGSSGFIIKRVFRLAGERVPLDKWPGFHHLEDGPYSVPDGNIYVLGDNQTQSEDSRIFGPVPQKSIVGKVVIRP